MMNLYTLTGAALELQNLLEAGEIEEDVYQDTLENLDIDKKIENICAVIRNLEAEALAFKEEKDRMASRQKTAENGIKRLKESLLNHLTVTNQNKVKSGLFSVSLGSSEKVIVTDQKQIPSEFLIPQEAKIDLATIKKLLKNGEDIDGVTIESSNYIRIR